MTTDLKQLDPKDPAEIVPLTFEFESLTISPSSPVVTVTRHSGTADDSDLSLMLVGSPQVIGTTVVQKVQGGVARTNYKFRCDVVTPDGCHYALAGILPVETA